MAKGGSSAQNETEQEQKRERERDGETEGDWHGNRGCWVLGAVVITRATNKSRQLKTEPSTHTHTYTCNVRVEKGMGGSGGEEGWLQTW